MTGESTEAVCVWLEVVCSDPCSAVTLPLCVLLPYSDLIVRLENLSRHIGTVCAFADVYHQIRRGPE